MAHKATYMYAQVIYQFHRQNTGPLWKIYIHFTFTTVYFFMFNKFLSFYSVTTLTSFNIHSLRLGLFFFSSLVVLFLRYIFTIVYKMLCSTYTLNLRFLFCSFFAYALYRCVCRNVSKRYIWCA